MSSTTDKIKGVANQATGNVKQGVGKAVGRFCSNTARHSIRRPKATSARSPMRWLTRSGQTG